MDPVTTYIHSFLVLDNPQLEVLERGEEAREDIQPSIGPEVGKFLGLLIRLTRAQRVLELGSSIGYSTIWLAQALSETGGRLLSVECDEGRFDEAKHNVSAAGLWGSVALICEDATTVLDGIHEPFDLILQDADKALYPSLLDRCIELTRDQGLIVADDVLFKPRGIPPRLSDPIDLYNQRVFADSRLYSTILPIGDGITVSLKLPDPTGKKPTA